VQNGIDRFHLVRNVTRQLPTPDGDGAYLAQMMDDKLIEHKAYVDQHGEDMPEILDWVWGAGP
jgi:xylulose-5-phosphate/fructose-6-phosphate phosphoketolase